MYFLSWNYEKLLPTCSVCYEKESYLSVTEQQEEEQIVRRLKELCEVFNSITEQINQNGFPDLCPVNYKYPEREYPLYSLAPQKDIGIIEIECDKIIGGNWANMPFAEIKGDYPKPRKFVDLLKGYLNLNDQLKNTRDSIPPIPVYKIFDDYFCDEGNHRLYVSRLLKFETIKAEVLEFDYLAFLQNSYLHETSMQTYIAYPVKENGYAQLNEININEVHQYKKLKEKYKGY
jgi:hypothetical protein